MVQHWSNIGITLTLTLLHRATYEGKTRTASHMYLLIILQVLSSYTTKELDAYAKSGSIAEEVLSSVRTVAAYGGERKEFERWMLSQMRDDYTTNSHYRTYIFTLYKVRRMYFLNLGVKGLKFHGERKEFGRWMRLVTCRQCHALSRGHV